MSQYETPTLTCNIHQQTLINGFCIQAECNYEPAQCFECTLASHRDCFKFFRRLTDIPKLTQPYYQMKNGLIQIQWRINQLIKELITSIEQQILPISQYFDNPNLTNLNELGKYLKSESELVLQNQIIEKSKQIPLLFSQYIKIFISDIQKSKQPELNTIQTNQNIQEGKVQIQQGNKFFNLQEYIEASKYYQKAIQVDPNNINIFRNQGNKLFSLKLYVAAINYYEKAIELDPNNNKNTWLNLGHELFDLKEYINAINYYEKAIEDDPNNKNIWLYQGNELFSQKLYVAAIKYYEKAIQVDPDNKNIWFSLGNELFNQKLYEPSLIYYQKALEDNPNNQLAVQNIQKVQKKLTNNT